MVVVAAKVLSALQMLKVPGKIFPDRNQGLQRFFYKLLQIIKSYTLQTIKMSLDYNSQAVLSVHAALLWSVHLGMFFADLLHSGIETRTTATTN